MRRPRRAFDVSHEGGEPVAGRGLPAFAAWFGNGWMRADTRKLLTRFLLTLAGAWAFTLVLMFGLYFGLRAALGLWR
jgi:hypothetical protein